MGWKHHLADIDSCVVECVKTRSLNINLPNLSSDTRNQNRNLLARIYGFLFDMWLIIWIPLVFHLIIILIKKFNLDLILRFNPFDTFIFITFLKCSYSFICKRKKQKLVQIRFWWHLDKMVKVGFWWCWVWNSLSETLGSIISALWQIC